MVLAGVKIVSALMCGGISVLLFGAPARFALGVEAVLALAEAKGVDMLINTRQPAVAGAIRGAHGLPGGNGPLNDTEKRRVMPALSGLAGFVSTVVAVTANMLKARDMRHKGQPALPDLSQLARQAESSTLKKMLYQARLLGRRLEESALQRMLHRHALIPPVLGILLGTAIGYAEGKIADGVLRHSEKRPR